MILGVTSSLHPDNIRNARVIRNLNEFINSDTTEINGTSIRNHSSYEKIHLNMKNHKFQLLFDPQTSGGLVGCVPRNNVKNIIEKLKNAGYHHATVIGEVTKTNPGQILLKY